MPKKKTLKEFLKQAIEVHKDRYDYILITKITNFTTEVPIICKNHGMFMQKPTYHLGGSGCKICSENVKLTLDVFINKSNIIHNFKYDYSLFILINNKTPGKIICNETDKFGNIHGVFEQRAKSHLRGFGCKKCKKRMNIKKLTLTNFINIANKIHNFKYDYSLIIKLSKAKDMLEIICPDHGIFFQTLNNHLNNKHGCTSCGGSEKITLLQFIERSNLIHNCIYNYSLIIEIKNVKTDVPIICKIHGMFYQSPDNHLKGKGCIDCVNKRKTTIFNFINKANIIHNFIYNYSLINNNFFIKNNLTKVPIICSKHGVFFQSICVHLRGSGCQHCLNNKNENLVRKFLTDNNVDFIYEYKVKLPINKKYSEIDFYIPFLNLFIEYNGAQHFKPIQFGGISINKAEANFKRQKIRDEQLREYCKNNNINLLEIDGRVYQDNKLKQFLLEYFTGSNPVDIDSRQVVKS